MSMNLIRALATLPLLAIATMSLAATDLTGVWKCKVIVGPPAGNVDDAEAKPMKELASHLVSRLIIRKDGSYRIEVEKYKERRFTDDATENFHIKGQTEEGMWSQKDDKLSFTQTRDNHRRVRPENAQTHVLTLSKDGKTLSATEGGITMVFSR